MACLVTRTPVAFCKACAAPDWLPHCARRAASIWTSVNRRLAIAAQHRARNAQLCQGFQLNPVAGRSERRSTQIMHVSPNVWDEAIAYLIPVFRISRQVPGKDFLLVRYAEIQNGQEDRVKQQRPPRAKRKRRADEEKKRAEIHRMSDQCMHASR